MVEKEAVVMEGARMGEGRDADVMVGERTVEGGVGRGEVGRA